MIDQRTRANVADILDAEKATETNDPGGSGALGPGGV